MRKRLLATLLVIALLASLMTTGVMAAPYDGGETGGSTPSTTSNVSSNNNGVHVAKSLSGTGTDDDPYKLTLEAWVQGDFTPEESKPMDIVLVLDVSGSMDDGFTSSTSYNYAKYREYMDNEDYYSWSNRENLWYSLGNGEYTKVTIERDSQSIYTPIDNSHTNQYYYTNRNDLYCLYNDEYVKIDVSRSWIGNSWNGRYSYTYTMPDGSTISSERNNSYPQFEGYQLFLRNDDDNYTYTYSYQDASGIIVTVLGGSGNESPDLELYYRYTDTSTTSKMKAMQEAVNDFIKQVTQNSSKHQIAIVKFADDSYQTNNQGYHEVGNDFNRDGYNKTQVVIDFTNSESNLTQAVDRLEASGATAADYGLDLAQEVFNGQGETLDGARDDSKKVVVFFTDGDPNHGNGFDEDVASDAVNSANDLKNGFGATVYTVGIFSGADPDSSSRSNNYMNAVSSNYPEAEVTDWWGNESSNWSNLKLGTRDANGNYYLAASDADELKDVFETIGGDITSEDVDATSTLSDTLSEYFDFGDNISSGNTGDVTVQVVSATGNNSTAPEWSTSGTTASGVTVTVNDDKISVSGFDYSDASNVVVYNDGSWHGNKLVITFPIEVDEAACINNPLTDGIYPTNATATTEEQAGLRYGNSGVLLDKSPTVNVGNVSYNGTDITVEVYVDGVKQTAPLDYVNIDRHKSSDFENFRLVSNDSGTLTYDFDYNPDNGNDCVDIDVSLDDSNTYFLQGIVYHQDKGRGSAVNVSENAGTYTVDNVSASETDNVDVKIYLSTKYQVKYYLDGDENTPHAAGTFIAHEGVQESSYIDLTGEGTPQNATQSWKNSGYSTSVTPKTLPKVAGSTVSGWYLGTSSGSLVSDNVNITVDNDTADKKAADHVIELHAVSELNTYDVTYDWGAHTPSDASLPTGNTDVIPGTPVSVDATVTDAVQVIDKENHKIYTFDGWEITRPAGVTISDGKFNMPASDVVLTAKWKETDETSYKVTYEWDGEAPSDVQPPAPETGKYEGEEITVAENPTSSAGTNNAGVPGTWTFDGWTSTNVDVSSGSFAMPANNVIITGKWTFTPNTYTITIKYQDENGNTLHNDTVITDKNYNEAYTYTVGTDPETPDSITTSEEITYVFDKLDAGSDALLGNVTENVTITLVYAKDSNGDSTADKYQVFLEFVADPEEGGRVSTGALTITFPNNATSGVVNISNAVTAEAAEGYQFEKWTWTYNETPYTANETSLSGGIMPGVTVQGGTTIKITANFIANAPALEVTKVLSEVNGGDYVAGNMVKVGDALTYTITVKNTGNVTLTNISVTDTLTVDGESRKVTLSKSVIDSLEPGATDTVTATYTVAEADAGKTITNTAVAKSGTTTGEPEDPPTVEVEDPAYTVTKELTSAKRGETTYTGESLKTYKARVGDVLTYTIKVENTGNVSLDLTLTDTFTGAGPLDFTDGNGYTVTGPVNGKYTITVTNLAVAGTLEITATYTVEDGDVANGSFTNTVTDNAGGEPDPEDPTVPVEMDDYTVTITVADMLIYTGGNPYGGIIDASGDLVTDADVNDGLPEPGYHIVLSAAVVQWLNDNDIEAGDGSTTEATRLENVLHFTYNVGYTERYWELSYVGVYSTNDDGTPTQYVYSIESDSITNTPVRIQYTNEAGTVVTDDDIIMSDTNVKETFTMSIYSGGLTQTEIKAVLSGENEGQTITANISLVDGELEIRSTTGEEYSSQVDGNDNDPSKITADANEGTKFFVNETQVELTEDERARVHLLVDDVSDSEEFNAAMGVDAISEAPAGVSLTNARYVLAYMDLVDSGNGNAVITMNEGGSVKVSWPMPADAAADSEFYIVHYTGLDRDSVITADALDNAAKDIISGDKIKVENGYVTFNVSSFSPFALVYEQKSADAPDVEVTKTVSGRTPEVGDTVRYTVTVTNTGNTVLNNVTVTDTMWENGTVIYVDGQRQVLTGDEYSIDSIAVGSSVVITYYYSVTRSDANDEITNHVEVTVPDGPSDETETTIDVDPYMPNIPDPDDDPDPVEPDFDFVPNWLNTTDHFAYIVGYEDGTIRPTNNITRAEVATIFFRLLTDDAREEFWSQTNDYTDVAADAWYNNAVSTLSNMGIIDGYEDGTFKPNASITRAEFTAIATRFFDYTAEYEGAFNDVTYSDWYADCVQAAVDMGLVNGYADGGFRPNAYITRAESCAIVNRVLNRVPHEDYLLDEDEMITWPDNSYGAWYYADMQEATNSHDYDWIRVSGEVVEEWTDKLAERDWEALEQQWSTAYSG